MAKNKRNYNQDHFKVAGSPQPADEHVPDREKQKLTSPKENPGGRKQRRVTAPEAGDGPDA